MSMSTLTQTSASSTSTIHRRLPSENNKKFRDASFSSYLDVSEETFVLQLGRNTNTPSDLSSSISTDDILIEKTKPDDTEIEVFDAEKYFNDALNQRSSRQTHHKTSPNNHHHLKKHETFEIKDPNRIETPSIRSVSSSNSRSALLHKAPRNHPKPRQANKKINFLSSIRCNCYCNDKNSIDIDDHYATETCSIDRKPKDDHRTSHHHLVLKKPVYNYVKFDQPELRLNPDGHFSFPVYTPKPLNPPKNPLQNPDHDHIKTRQSLQVFGSPIQDNTKNGSSLERKLSMLTWDAISPSGGGIAEEIRIPPTSYEDSDSDASSDLFEIESLTKGNSFLFRQGSDRISDCITPRNGYAPSEASIEWSVVTASVADYSVLSDSEELRKNVEKKMEMPKRRSSITLGCKSQKAVRVAGDAHHRVKRDVMMRSESFTRFYDESSKSGGFDAVKRQQSFDARILSQSN